MFAYFATNSTAFSFPPANVKASTTFLASAPVKAVNLYCKKFPNYEKIET